MVGKTAGKTRKYREDEEVNVSKLMKLSFSIAAVLVCISSVQAALVSVGYDSLNVVADNVPDNYITTKFSTWDGASDRHIHTLIKTDVATFTAALEAALGPLGAGESYQINSVQFVVGDAANDYQVAGAEAHRMITPYNAANVTFNDSDTSTDDEWATGSFSSSDYDGTDQIVGDGIIADSATTFTLNASLVQGWIDSGASDALVFTGGGVSKV